MRRKRRVAREEASRRERCSVQRQDEEIQRERRQKRSRWIFQATDSGSRIF